MEVVVQMQEQGRKKYQAINMHVHFANKHTERLHRLNSDPENRCKHVPSQLALFLPDGVGGLLRLLKTPQPHNIFQTIVGFKFSLQLNIYTLRMPYKGRARFTITLLPLLSAPPSTCTPVSPHNDVCWNHAPIENM